jgi:nitrogenase molybdenum-iron protein alpha chain
MSLISETKALTRERRSGALCGYNGPLEGLITAVSGDVKQTVRTFSQSAPDEIIYALRVLCGVEDSAIVVHGGVGCAAAAEPGGGVRVYSTNLDERDTILGGDDELRAAITRACAERAPRAVFVVGTPVIAINNDDTRSIIMELEDELGVKIVFVGTDGFKSKAAVTGYDVVSHALLRGLVESETQEAGEFVNVVSMSESAGDVAAAVHILDELGLVSNVIPRFSSVPAIARAGSAIATVALNGGEGEYLAIGLEESFGVRYIRTDTPIGAAAAERFVSAIARELSREEQAAEYVRRFAESVPRAGEGDGQFLEGASFFLNMDLCAAAGFAELIGEFGGVVTGFAVPYVDSGNRSQLDRFADKKITAIVAGGQQFEIANALSKTRPDYFIGAEGNTSSALSMGVVPISLSRIPTFGLAGVEAFAGLMKKIKKIGGIRSTGEKNENYYRDAWLRKSGNWYVKLEVR